MDLDQATIAHVLRANDIQGAIEAKVDPELMKTPEGKLAWEWMVAYFAEHGEGPTEAAFQDEFPKYVLVETGAEPLDYLVKRLRTRRMHNHMTQGVREVAELLKVKDSYGAAEKWAEVGLKAQEDFRPSRDVNWVANPEERYEHYEALKEHQGITGLTTPWDTLNEAILGIQEEDLVYIVARQNVGKTWSELIMAHHVWQAEMKRPLILTKEMSVFQIMRRLDARHFGLPYQKLRAGELGTEVEMEWRASMQELVHMHDFWVSGDDSEGGVSGVASKINAYRPDGGVWIDGGTFLMDERKGKSQWERVANVTVDLKKVARNFGVPIICTFQLSKRATNSKGSADDIAWGDIARDADVIIRATQTPEQYEEKAIGYCLDKQREGPKGITWECRFDFDIMDFHEIGARPEQADAEEDAQVTF